MPSKAMFNAFSQAVIARDGTVCKVCNDYKNVNPHLITQSIHLPAGGYVPEKGIMLCYSCRVEALEYHRGYIKCKGLSPEDLYLLIGSSKEEAHIASVESAESIDSIVSK